MGENSLYSYTLLLAMSPPQWAVVIALTALVFAPRLLRPLGYLLGRLLAMELRRRTGLPPLRTGRVRWPGSEGAAERATEPRTHESHRSAGNTDQPTPNAEVLPPEHPHPTLRASNPTSLAPAKPGKSPAAIWLAAVVVVGAVTVLFWLLLHAR